MKISKKIPYPELTSLPTFHFTSSVKTFTFDQECSSFQRIDYFSFLVDLMSDDGADLTGHVVHPPRKFLLPRTFLLHTRQLAFIPSYSSS